MRQVSFTRKLLYVIAGTFLIMVVIGLSDAPKASAAACTNPATDYGSVTQTVNITTAQSYRLWARMKASSTDATANSFLLEIGNTAANTQCFTVGDDNANISQTDWKWIDYNATGSATNNYNFTTTGTYTVKMIGREAGVKLDRLIFISASETCITRASTGNGDTCAPSAVDTTPPTVNVTAPTAATTVTGSSVNVTANATDAGGVAGVQFKLDGNNLSGEDISAPYAVAWDTTSTTNGSHTLTAIARDTAGNVTTSAPVIVTINNLPVPPTNQPDLVVIVITASPANPAPGQAVTFTATVKNQGTAATTSGPGVQFKVGINIVSLHLTDSAVIAAGQTVNLVANGGPGGATTWPAGASATYTVQAYVDDLNQIAESNETNNVTGLQLSVGATVDVRENVINTGTSATKIDIFDLTAVAGQYGCPRTPVDPACKVPLGRENVVNNGTSATKIDIFDLTAVAGQYGCPRTPVDPACKL